MEVKALKTGKFAHPEPCKPVVVLKRGETVDVDLKMADALISSGWGEKYEKKKRKKAKK